MSSLLNEEFNDTRMLTATELAKMLQISVRGVWRQVSKKQMPKPIYIGRLARWPLGLGTIKEWMKNGCPASDVAPSGIESTRIGDEGNRTQVPSPVVSACHQKPLAIAA